MVPNKHIRQTYGTGVQLPIVLLLWAEEQLGDMVEQTDALCLKRMIELTVTDIWYVCVPVQLSIRLNACSSVSL